MAILINFVTNMGIYIEITKYEIQVYFSQRSQKYVNDRSFVMLLNLNNQRDVKN